MTKMIHVLNKINELENLKNEIQDLWEEFLKNKEYSLDEKWNIFVKYGEIFGRKDGWCQRFDIEKKVEINWFEDYNTHRRETVILSNFIEWIEENLEEWPKWNRDLINEFKEEILQKNLWSYRFDW